MRPSEAGVGGREILFPDMGMWGMLLWVIEYAESNGHGVDGLRGRWRPLEAARPRIFFSRYGYVVYATMGY